MNDQFFKSASKNQEKMIKERQEMFMRLGLKKIKALELALALLGLHCTFSRSDFTERD